MPLEKILFVYRDALVTELMFPFHNFIPRLLADLHINPCQLPPMHGGTHFILWSCVLGKVSPLSIAVFRKVFQCYNKACTSPSWVYIRQKHKSPQIFNSASDRDNNQQWKDYLMGLQREGGDWGNPLQIIFWEGSDGSPKISTLSPEERIFYDELIKDNGQTVNWTLLEEFSLNHVGLTTTSAKGIIFYHYLSFFNHKNPNLTYLHIFIFQLPLLLTQLPCLWSSRWPG